MRDACCSRGDCRLTMQEQEKFCAGSDVYSREYKDQTPATQTFLPETRDVDVAWEFVRSTFRLTFESACLF